MILALLIAGCGPDRDGSSPSPTEVSVINVSEQSVPLELSYMARTAGVREVDVRARVSGILLRRLFKEGAHVKEGDLLFRIEPAPYEAEASHARAQVSVAAARAGEAERQLRRTEALVDRGVISRREHDEAVAAYESAAATLSAARAALRTAELNLSNTDVRAPINGWTSREARSEGSLINPDDDSALLTRISQSDRLYVRFSMPVNEATTIRNEMLRGLPVQVLINATDRPDFSQLAVLEFVDTLVDRGSGTVEAYATLRNDDLDLLPGQFVRALVTGLTMPSAVIVPTRGILRNAMGATVWVVDQDHKVQPRAVQLGQSNGNHTIISSGLAPGESVIVEGIMKVQPGMVVRPVLIVDKPNAPLAAN